MLPSPQTLIRYISPTNKPPITKLAKPEPSICLQLRSSIAEQFPEENATFALRSDCPVEEEPAPISVIFVSKPTARNENQTSLPFPVKQPVCRLLAVAPVLFELIQMLRGSEIIVGLSHSSFAT